MFDIKERAKKIFKNTDADVILIMNTDKEDSSFLYLTGFRGGTFEYTPILLEKERMKLYVSELEYGIAKREKPKGAELHLLDANTSLLKTLATELRGKRVGINGAFLPYRIYSILDKLKPHPKKIIDVSKALALARLVKDEEEASNLRTAARITKRVIETTKEELKIGMTEEQVAGIIDSKIIQSGADTSFRGIVAFDANTALPHHSPGSAKLKENSIVLFDVGARYKNYCGDITRTFMFKPDKKSSKYKRFSDIYGVVERAQLMALETIREGVTGSKPDNAARGYIDKYNGGIYKDKFIHSLGHSIGIDVHDGGAGLSPSSKLKLKYNMAFSDEPGIYIEGFGGVRIEDDVLVGKRSSTFL